MDLIKFIFEAKTIDELYINKRITEIKSMETINGLFKYEVYYGTSQHLTLEEIDGYCTKCTELFDIVYYLKQNDSYIILKDISLYIYYLSLLNRFTKEKTVYFSKILGMICLDEYDVDGLEYNDSIYLSREFCINWFSSFKNRLSDILKKKLECDIICDYEDEIYDKKVNDLIDYVPSDKELIKYFKTLNKNSPPNFKI
jgi:hypothetical protein